MKIGIKLGNALATFNFKKASYSFRQDVLYNILIQFGRTMKPLKLTKMCLNETYSKLWTGKHLSDVFPIQSSKQDAITPPISTSS
jgi:hypothetical protein